MGMRRDIEFKNTLSIEDRESFEYIWQKVKEVNKGDFVYINFYELKMLDSNKLPLLIILVRLLYSVVSQSIYINATQELVDYLYSIGFFKLGYVSKINLQLKKKESHYSVFPIKKFVGRTGREDLLRLVQGCKLDNESIKESVELIIENLSDNCLEHTSSDPDKIDCFAYVNNYENLTEIIIMDFGDGFYNSFRRRGTAGKLEGNREAVHEVLSYARTSRSEYKYGMGIKLVKKIIGKNNGKITLITGDALVEYYEGQVQSNVEIPFFQGSCFYIKWA